MTALPHPRAQRSARKELALALVAGWLALPAAGLLGARPAPAVLLGVGSLALLQLALFLLARDPRAARGCLLLTTVQGIVAATVTPDLLGGPIAAATLALTLLGQVAVARHAVRETLPPRLPLTRADRPGEGLLRGGLRSLATALAVLFVATCGSILLAAAGSALTGSQEEGTEVAELPDDSPLDPDSDIGNSNDAQRVFDGAFPESLEWATASPLRDDTPVIVLTPTEATGDEWLSLPPLHVHGRVLERFTRTGLGAHAGAATVELGAEGGAGGWVDLSPQSPQLPGETLLEFAIEQMPLRIGEREESLLFTPTPLVALDCPNARIQPEREVHAPLPDGGLLRFRARSLERRFERCLIPENADSDAPPITMELPAPSSELALIQATAIEVTRGAADDRERVALVMAFFRQRFEYDPKPTGVPGLAGLVDFLERRSGGCTHYAATATLMLRSLGVPARVATGFLARPPETEFGSFEPNSLVATPRSAHAWFEVPFEGLGWVTCDPTPVAASALGVGAFDLLGQRPWWADGAEILAGFLDGRSVSLNRVGEALGDLVTRVGGMTGLLLGAALFAALWIALHKRARSRDGTALSPSPSSSRDDSPLERLQLALSRAGVPRPPTSTLREHARRLVARNRPALQPLEGLVERLYGMRFGGEAWAEQDAKELTRMCAELNRE